VVTRNGVPVGELVPLRRYRFVRVETVRPTSTAHRVLTSCDFVAISICKHHKTLSLVADASRPLRGVIDTSVLIDLEKIDAQLLLASWQSARSRSPNSPLALTPLMTLTSERVAKTDSNAPRRRSVHWLFDADAARAYGRVFAEKRRQVARRAEPGR